MDGGGCWGFSGDGGGCVCVFGGGGVFLCVVCLWVELGWGGVRLDDGGGPLINNFFCGFPKGSLI